MQSRWTTVAVFAISAFFAQFAFAATYKWIDEKGVVQYSDRMPADGNKASATRLNSSGVSVSRTEAQKNQTEVGLSVEALEQQKAEAKRQVERQRRDAALLATYSNENEIEAAREREQKRHQEILKTSTAGLAASQAPEDKRKLDTLLLQGQRDADAINAKFDAQKARFRELTTAPVVAPARTAKPQAVTLNP